MIFPSNNGYLNFQNRGIQHDDDDGNSSHEEEHKQKQKHWYSNT